MSFCDSTLTTLIERTILPPTNDSIEHSLISDGAYLSRKHTLSQPPGMWVSYGSILKLPL
jgi:hypothetical protein